MSWWENVHGCTVQMFWLVKFTLPFWFQCLSNSPVLHARRCLAHLCEEIKVHRRWLEKFWKLCDFLLQLNENKSTVSSSIHARILLKDEQHKSSSLLENFHKGGLKNCIWCVRTKWIYSNGEEHGVNLPADRSLQVNHVSSHTIRKDTCNVLSSELSKFTY